MVSVRPVLQPLWVGLAPLSQFSKGEAMLPFDVHGIIVCRVGTGAGLCRIVQHNGFHSWRYLNRRRVVLHLHDADTGSFCFLQVAQLEFLEGVMVTAAATSVVSHQGTYPSPGYGVASAGKQCAASLIDVCCVALGTVVAMVLSLQSGGMP